MYSTGWIGALEGLDGSAQADSTPRTRMIGGTVGIKVRGEPGTLSQFEPEAPDGTASAAVSLAGPRDSPAARNSVWGDSELWRSSMALLS